MLIGAASAFRRREIQQLEFSNMTVHRRQCFVCIGFKPSRFLVTRQIIFESNLLHLHRLAARTVPISKLGAAFMPSFYLVQRVCYPSHDDAYGACDWRCRRRLWRRRRAPSSTASAAAPPPAGVLACRRRERFPGGQWTCPAGGYSRLRLLRYGERMNGHSIIASTFTHLITPFSREVEIATLICLFTLAISSAHCSFCAAPQRLRSVTLLCENSLQRAATCAFPILRLCSIFVDFTASNLS